MLRIDGSRGIVAPLSARHVFVIRIEYGGRLTRNPVRPDAERVLAFNLFVFSHFKRSADMTWILHFKQMRKNQFGMNKKIIVA